MQLELPEERPEPDLEEEGELPDEKLLPPEEIDEPPEEPPEDPPDEPPDEPPEESPLLLPPLLPLVMLAPLLTPPLLLPLLGPALLTCPPPLQVIYSQDCTRPRLERLDLLELREEEEMLDKTAEEKTEALADEWNAEECIDETPLLREEKCEELGEEGLPEEKLEEENSLEEDSLEEELSNELLEEEEPKHSTNCRLAIGLPAPS